MTIDYQKLHEVYQKRFKTMNDQELIDAFNQEVGNSGWTGARAQYLSALREEFMNRNYDCRAITSGEAGFSYQKPIRLVNNKIEIMNE